ncbi:MAG TPA: molybdopterin cofactor-binding domain-containing protein [Thermoanaerobaculia bacterium]|jgi:isoquinoline 1-oxidoreductase beta subunit
MSEFNRRDFLRITGVGTGAVVFSCYISPELALGQEKQSIGSILHEGISLLNPLKFVYLDPITGNMTIWAHRSEMGQGIKSTLAAVLVDEMEADWSRVTVKQADADAEAFGIAFPYAASLPKELPLDQSEPPIVRGEDAQFADSSRSMAAYFDAFRAFGAGVRMALSMAAARHFNVDLSQIEARQHKVSVKGGGRSVDYGDPRLLFHLNKLNEEKKLPPDTDAILAYRKPPSEWRYIGKQMPFIDAQDMVNGKAVYGADVEVPGGLLRAKMLTAMIVRCPVANGSLKSFNPEEAMKVPGVKHVVAVLPQGVFPGGVGAAFNPHAGVAVIAENTWAAWQGRRALVNNNSVQWDLGPHASYDSAAFRDEMKSSTSQPGKVMRNKGDVDAAFGSAAKTVEAHYHIPHLAQAPMEPPVAISVYDNGTWDIWAPSQGPELLQHYVGVALLEPNVVKQLVWNVEDRGAFTAAQVAAGDWQRQDDFNKTLAQALGVDEKTLLAMRDDLKKRVRSSVRVHVPLLGGGFGRKSKPDYAMEAAFLARQFPGTPIRVQWTREDDIKFSYYNAAAGQYWKAGLGGDGLPTALLWRGAATSFFGTLFPAGPDVFQKARQAFHNGGTDGYLSAIERAHGFEDMPYDVPNIRIENCVAKNHIRTGWMRSVANIYHAFATCSFADEMANAAGRDSKDYLLDLIGKGHRYRQKEFEDQGVKAYDNNLFPVEKRTYLLKGVEKLIIPQYPPDTRRLRAVVERVAQESGWNQKVQQYKGMKGRGLGIAAHRSFLSYVAIVADVSLNDKNELTVNEIWGVIDCGRAVNPDRVAAQMEGGIVYGLSYALLGEITCKNGAVEQNNFDDYPVARMNQVPRMIHTIVQDPPREVADEYDDKVVPPTGVGEPPTPAVAPAIANAIVAAGGPRIREIPFLRQVTVL